MGGETTELSETTTDVVIEAAHFDAVSIFRTERRHKLPSEASKRFERGVDPELPAAAADRVVELMVELGGATADPGVTVVGQAPGRRTLTAATDLPALVTGLDSSADTALKNLQLVARPATVHSARTT